MKSDGRIERFLHNWREDYIYQTLISAAASFSCIVLFALYNGYLGLWHGSVWHGGIGVFYLLLVAIRGMILLTEKRGQTRSETEQERCRRRTFLVSSFFLLALDLVLMLPIAMMAVLGKPVTMGLIPAIAMAAYSIWKLTLASLHINWQRHKAGGNILIAELRTVNLIDALVAILTLQNTLIMVKRTDAGENSMLPVSAASSAVIYAVIVVITLRMLHRGLRQMKRQEKAELPTKSGLEVSHESA